MRSTSDHEDGPRETKRQLFDKQLALLLGAFPNVPAKPEILEAYWTAFKSLHIAAFTRMVEQAVGPNCTTKRLPTVGDLWEIYRELRKRAEASMPPPSATAPTGDRFQITASRMLWLFMYRKGPFDQLTLAQLIAARAKLISDYRLIATEEEVTDHEFCVRAYTRFASITGVTDVKLTAEDLQFDSSERARAVA